MMKTKIAVGVGLVLLTIVMVVIVYFLNTSNEIERAEFVDVGWWNIRDFGTSSRDDTDQQ